MLSIYRSLCIGVCALVMAACTTTDGSYGPQTSLVTSENELPIYAPPGDVVEVRYLKEDNYLGPLKKCSIVQKEQNEKHGIDHVIRKVYGRDVEVLGCRVHSGPPYIFFGRRAESERADGKNHPDNAGYGRVIVKLPGTNADAVRAAFLKYVITCVGARIEKKRPLLQSMGIEVPVHSYDAIVGGIRTSIVWVNLEGPAIVLEMFLSDMRTDVAAVAVQSLGSDRYAVLFARLGEEYDLPTLAAAFEQMLHELHKDQHNIVQANKAG